jgi:hypothetical protein
MPDYRAMARAAAARYGIDAYLFERQIEAESNFDPGAGSSAGAQGIAQIVPRWHPGVDPWNPEEALDYAARLMSNHLNNYDGDWRLALAAYNAGPGAVAQYGGVPPFAETQGYISRIMQNTGGGGGGRLMSPLMDPEDEIPFDDNPDDPFAGVGIRSDAKLNVPGNIEPWIDAASRETGVPFGILAAIVYQHSRWSGLTPALIYQVASAISSAKRGRTEGSEVVLPPGGVGGMTQQDFERERWISAAADYGSRGAPPGSESYTAYRDQLARLSGPNGWAIGPDIKLPTGKFTIASFPGGIGGGSLGGAEEGFGPAGRRIAGLSADDEDAAHAIADSVFLRILGRLPTDDEYRNIIRKGMTPVTLEDHLRAQPNPNAPGKTLGQTADVRSLARKWASDTLGRDPSEGEVNFLLVNNIPASDDHVSAYYEQIRDKAVWQGDPVKWRDMRSRMQRVWDSLGLTGDVDANTVNTALAEGWTEQRARETFRTLPAPGHAAGTTVGQINDLRLLAAKFKGELFVEEVTDAELKQLVGASPDEIRAYYRSLPSRNIPGLQAGMAEDYKSIAQQVLKQFGIIDHEPTADEVRLFALGKYDAEKIVEHYGDDPALAARQPGLPYGLSREDYERQVSDYQAALTGSLGRENAQKFTPPSVGLPGGDTAAGRDQSLLGYALRRKMSAERFGSLVEKFRQEQGRAPTGTELGERMNRAEDVFVPYRGQVAEPAISMTEAGPTISGTQRGRGTPRPAI